MKLKLNKKVVPPEGGWEAHTWYKGKCSMRLGNPKFSVLIYSGFLNGKDKTPMNYSGVFAANYVPSDPVEDVWRINEPMILEVGEKLWTVE